MASNRAITVGLLGLGNVGSGVVQVLNGHQEAIAAKAGGPIRIKKILVRSLEKLRSVAIDPTLLTTDAEEILADPEIDIVCELIGGVNPAHQYISEALERGKQVVTANKELMARHGHAILADAAARRQDVYFEGAVAGGIPIIRPLKVDRPRTGFSASPASPTAPPTISSRAWPPTVSSSPGARSAVALAYAEADPTYDVEGWMPPTDRHPGGHRLPTPVDVDQVYPRGHHPHLAARHRLRARVGLCDQARRQRPR